MRIVTLTILFYAGMNVFSQQAVFAQQEQPPADSATVAEEVAVESAADTVVVDIPDSLQFSRPQYRYQSSGRRDPFESLVPEEIDDENRIKQLFDYENSTILGVVHSEEDPYVLLLDNADNSYVLRVGDRVLGGYVTQITDGAVYLHIVKYGRAMNIILRMESSRYTVIEEQAGVTSLKKPGINIIYESEPVTAQGVVVEEVTVPLTDVRMVEDVWFGDDAGGYSPQGISVGDIIPVYPAAGAQTELPCQFDWSIPNDVGTFTLIIDDTPDFSSPLVVVQNIVTNSYTISRELGLPVNLTLYWRVTSVSDSGIQHISEPEIMSFTISGP